MLVCCCCSPESPSLSQSLMSSHASEIQSIQLEVHRLHERLNSLSSRPLALRQRQFASSNYDALSAAALHNPPLAPAIPHHTPPAAIDKPLSCEHCRTASLTTASATSSPFASLDLPLPTAGNATGQSKGPDECALASSRHRTSSATDFSGQDLFPDANGLQPGQQRGTQYCPPAAPTVVDFDALEDTFAPAMVGGDWTMPSSHWGEPSPDIVDDPTSPFRAFSSIDENADERPATSTADADLRCWDHGCNGRRFSTRGNLARHQREKTNPEAKAHCARCGAFFSRTTARDKHVLANSCTRIRRYSNGRTRPLGGVKLLLQQSQQSPSSVVDSSTIDLDLDSYNLEASRDLLETNR